MSNKPRRRRRRRRKSRPALDVHDFKVGDSVVVKPGTIDPDLNIDIGGWQGRISEISPGNGGKTLVCIDWDSDTLWHMPGSSIEVCEERGLDWTKFYLFVEDVEPAQPRDTPADVEAAVAELSSQYAWAFLGEEGRRIQHVLAGLDEYDDYEAFEAWEAYLEEKLTFPFEGEVDEFQERGPLQAGDRVLVLRTSFVDGLYGVIVDVKRGRRTYEFPLCDLKVVDEASSNYQPVDDYSVWFANR